MKRDPTLVRAVLLRMTAQQLDELDRYVTVKPGVKTRTSAMRELLEFSLDVIERDRADRAAREAR